jgi:predicted TIM-barrel fold metal-dependent hydrolase
MKRDILKRALKGDKFNDIFIADCHCHMGTWYDFYFPKAGVNEMIADADKMCVDEIYVSPHAAISGNYKIGNIEAEEAVKKYPGRVFGYLVLNPNRPEEIDSEFERYYKNPGFPAIKIHPGLHHYPITGENYRIVFEKAKKLGGFILTHSWGLGGYNGVDMCEQMIRDYPDVALILGHAGGTYTAVQKAVEIVNKYENAYLDTSGFEYSNVWIESIMEKADNSKVLFGSDYPFHDQRPGLSRILFADLDDNVKIGILGENFKKLIAKYPKKG